MITHRVSPAIKMSRKEKNIWNCT